MKFENQPIDPENESKIEQEKKDFAEMQEQIIETVKKARKKRTKKDDQDVQIEESTNSNVLTNDSSINTDMSLEELAIFAKKLGMSEEEAEELINKRTELVKKHSDYIWGARQDLEDIDKDIWIITIEKDKDENDQEYLMRKDEKNIDTLSEAVKRGIVTLKEYNDYKSAKESIENMESSGADKNQVEKLKIILGKKEDEFAERMIQNMNDEYEKREELKIKIGEDLNSRTSFIERRISEVDEKITDLPENISKKKGLMKELVDSVRKIWLGKDGILGEKGDDGYHIESEDGRYGQRLNKSRKAKKELEEKREAEKNKQLNEFINDLRISTGRISAKHKQVLNNLSKILSKEDHDKLLEIMGHTQYTIRPDDFDKINSIRKSIVEHILLEEKLVLRDPNYIVPWAKVNSGYTRGLDFLLNSQTSEILNFYKKEFVDSDPVHETLTENESRISELRGENTVFKVLIGKKETSEIRSAFEDREYADKSGKFNELKQEYLKNKKAEQKLKEQKLKDIEKKKQEKVEIEKTVHEELSEDFIDFEIPVLDGKKLVGKHPVAIRFEAYVTEKKTVMLKVVEIIDKRPKNKDEIKPKEIEGFTLGRTFDLETLSGAPQWIKDGLNDDAKEKLINTIVIRENQK